MSLLIYHPDPLAVGEELELPAIASKHVQVLRKQPGMPLDVFDGKGTRVRCRITSMERKAVTIEALGSTYTAPDALQIHLIVGLIANDRMEWMIEKATELGVQSIQPVLLNRCTTRLPVASNGTDEEPERALKKRLRWQQISVSACEQSGRTWLPTIHPVRTLPTALSFLDDLADTSSHSNVCLILSTNTSSPSLPTRLAERKATDSVTYAIGCEGGLEESEYALLKKHDFESVSLGNAILRAETAPLAAIVSTQTYMQIADMK